MMSLKGWIAGGVLAVSGMGSAIAQNGSPMQPIFQGPVWDLIRTATGTVSGVQQTAVETTFFLVNQVPVAIDRTMAAADDGMEAVDDAYEDSHEQREELFSHYCRYLARNSNTIVVEQHPNGRDLIGTFLNKPIDYPEFDWNVGVSYYDEYRFRPPVFDFEVHEILQESATGGWHMATAKQIVRVQATGPDAVMRFDEEAATRWITPVKCLSSQLGINAETQQVTLSSVVIPNPFPSQDSSKLRVSGSEIVARQGVALNKQAAPFFTGWAKFDTYGCGLHDASGPTRVNNCSPQEQLMEDALDAKQWAEDYASLMITTVLAVAGNAVGMVMDAVDDAEEIVEDAEAEAQLRIDEAEAEAMRVIGEVQGMLQPCIDNPTDCNPAGPPPSEIEDTLGELIALVEDAGEQAEQAVNDVYNTVEGLGGDLTETGEDVQRIVNEQVATTFGHLNSTLLIVFDELNYLVGFVPGEARTTAQFVVDTANSEVQLLVSTAQGLVLFGIGATDSVVDTTFAVAEIVRAAAFDVVNSLPLYDNKEAYHAAIDQTFFALDNLVLRFLDENRAADRAVLNFRINAEAALRAGDGYTEVLGPDAHVDGAKARDTTLLVSGALVVASVQLGYDLVSGTGVEAIYEDLVCNRLGGCS